MHISLVGKEKMRVSWITEDKHTESVVEYGTKAGEYREKATGLHTSYQYFLYNSGKIHNVVIGPLQPGTTYFYRCGGSGPEFSFKTPPPRFPIEFVIVGTLVSCCWDFFCFTIWFDAVWFRINYYYGFVLWFPCLFFFVCPLVTGGVKLVRLDELRSVRYSE